MPTVRRLQPGQVPARALPSARLTAAETAQSEGAGLAEATGIGAQDSSRAIEGIARIGLGVATEMIQKERQDANEVALLKASNQLQTWKTKALYDPDAGALTLKGEAAQGIPEKIEADFNTYADTVGAGMSTPEQKKAFARMRTEMFAGIDLETRRHVFGEMQTFRANELQQAVGTGIDSAIRSAQDPKGVAIALTRIEQQIRVNAPKLGLGKEAVDAQVRAARSTVHLGVVNQLLALDQDRNASDYFAEVKDQIAADKLDDVEKALEEGSLRGDAQRKADEILLAGGTLKEQTEKAKTLDPKLRDAVQERLEHAEALRDRAEREDDEARQKRAYDIVDRTGNTTAIPPADWTKLTGATRSALKSYAHQKAEGFPVKTDLPTFYALMKQAGDDPAGFARTNLLSNVHKLSPSDFEQLAGMQISIKNGDRTKAEHDVADFMTQRQVADNALRQIGIDPDATMKTDPTTAQQVANFYRLVDTRVSNLQDLTSKKAGSSDVQKIVDDLLAQQVSVKSWFGMREQKKSIFALTVDDIPADQRTQIESALRGRNKPVSDPQILNLYLEALARGLVKR